MKKYVGAIFALTLLSHAAHAGNQIVDPGGDLREYARRVIRLQLHHKRLRLTGIYESAAIEYLQVAACIAPTAQFWVHEVHATIDGQDYREGVRDELWTSAAADMLPDCARALFMRSDAFKTPVLMLFMGIDLLRACPQIPSCGAN